jgi:3-deoxy-manno-octulosonate cytidylyltransferase (CMP-KDO synthetase)
MSGSARWRAKIGPVLVACDSPEIADAIKKVGGEAILTDPNHPSGSDRIWEALTKYDPAKKYTTIVNLQGDLPTLDSKLLPDLLIALRKPGTDIATLAAPIATKEEHENPSVVKAVVAASGRALYFTRTSAPYGEGTRYHHIGIYAYTRSALERFVALSPSPLELREKLEQLRALENGLQIEVAVVDTVPLGVDTPEDLERARSLLCQ